MPFSPFFSNLSETGSTLLKVHEFTIKCYLNVLEVFSEAFELKYLH